MIAKVKHAEALALIFSTRDQYVGEFQKPIAEIREPVRVIHIRKSGDHLLVAINDCGKVSTLVVTKVDSPGLELLSALDRASIQSAIAGVHRDTQEATDGPT